MGRRTKVFALDQKRVGLADQDHYGMPICIQKFDLAQLADGFAFSLSEARCPLIP
jgi:hypothetical protein